MPFKSEFGPAALRRSGPINPGPIYPGHLRSRDVLAMSGLAAFSSAPEPYSHMARLLPAVSQELTVDLPRSRYFAQLLHHFVQQPYDEMNLDLDGRQLDLELQWSGRCCRVVVWLDESSDKASTHVVFGIVKPFLTDCCDEPGFFTRLLDKIDEDLRMAVQCDPTVKRGYSMQELNELLL